MNNTMDTDYELPIPMHRPFITLDSQFDTPLPFRSRLKQVTQLTAENSTPYQLPKERRLSRFEELPFEVREQVYNNTISQSYAFSRSEYLVDIKYALGHTVHCEWHAPVFNNFDSIQGLLRVNRSLRQEVLDVLLDKTVASFSHPLRDKKMFYDNWHNLNAFDKFKFGPLVCHCTCIR
jgi:hypothetical protein